MRTPSQAAYLVMRVTFYTNATFQRQGVNVRFQSQQHPNMNPPNNVSSQTPNPTINEAAAELGVSRRFLEKEITAGKLPVVRLSARCIRIRRATLTAYLNAREVAA